MHNIYYLRLSGGRLLPLWLPPYFSVVFFSLNSNVFINIHEYVNEKICISIHHKTNCVLVIIWHQVCCFGAISSRDMSNFVG